MAATSKKSNEPDVSLLQPGGDVQSRRRSLANSLINTKFFPPYFTTIRQLALEAQAYHMMRPYPYWQFADWKVEDRGVLPRCLPLANYIVTKSAKWLFGKPVEIHVKEADKYEKFIRQAWQENRMPTDMVAAAERGGTDGGVVLKWSYDEKSLVCPLRFQILSVVNECRLFYDPHDRNDLLMARIQYPITNPKDGEMYLYREEWTDEYEVHYKPQRMTTSNIMRGGNYPSPIGQVPVIYGTKQEPDLYDRWDITSQTPNKFGLIPLHHIRNAEALMTYGKGDLWTDLTGGMFRILDRINLTYTGMDRSNQLYSEPTIVFIDAKLGTDITNRTIQPGSNANIKSDEGMGPTGGKQAQAILLESDGGMREHVRTYARDLYQYLLDKVGAVMVDTSEVGNKGNLTRAVLEQLYAPLIETTDQKRRTYGDDGIAVFLERVACGLKNIGAKMAGVESIDPAKHETYDVQLRWSEYFPLDDDGKMVRFTRVSQEADAGYLPSETAIEAVLQMEEVQDIVAAKKELKAAMDRQERMREATVGQAEADVEATKNPPATGPGGKAGAGAAWRNKSG